MSPSLSNYQLCNVRHITTGSLLLHLKNMNFDSRVTGRTLVKTTINYMYTNVCTSHTKQCGIYLFIAVLLAPAGSGHRRCSINIY